MHEIPVFAIVGHPNEGKSSVVSTLSEDDSVRISPIPGETVAARSYPVKLNEEEILRFVDTPGFQHPRKMEAWMKEREGEPGHPAAAFIKAHQSDPAWSHDLELMRPLAEGAGIIYVLDGSRPVRRNDLAEMEILRLTGNPRMAVINPKGDAATHLEDWKEACRKCFNSTRLFNAVHATYAERIALLESLKSIHQDWEPALGTAIEAFRDDWARRNRQVSAVICEFLRDAITHVERKKISSKKDEEAETEKLVKAYQASISRMEERAQKEIRRQYKHNLFNLDVPDHSILREDLFTEKTWQLLGLNKKQMIAAAGIVGGGAGLPIDLALGHLTFGVFTVSGALLGAGTALFRGEQMARGRVKNVPLGGVEISVGPNKSPQFPFILLDRILLYYEYVINWAHGRREEPVLKNDVDKVGFTSRWDSGRRATAAKFIKRVSGKNRSKEEEAEQAFREILEDVLLAFASD